MEQNNKRDQDEEVTYKSRVSKFISYFDKTAEGVHCPHFYVLAHANSKLCPFECEYCFARVTFRTQRSNVIIYTNYDRMLRQVGRWLAQTKEPSVLNAGEYCDFFIRETVQKSNGTRVVNLAERLAPLFAKYKRHKLLILTKSDGIHRFLQNVIPVKNFIISASVNCAEIANLHERYAPHPIRRAKALRAVQEQGWEDVRMRLDPGIPLKNWRARYGRTLRQIARTGLQPTRITLGTLRFFGGVAGCWKIVKMHNLTVKKSKEDNRYRLTNRQEYYEFILGRIDDLFPDAEVGLCKETLTLYEALGMRTDASQCNCLV